MEGTGSRFSQLIIPAELLNNVPTEKALLDPDSCTKVTSPSAHTCLHVKSLQSCLILYGPVDYSLPGSSVHGILQAKILEWVSMPTS